MKHLLVLMLGLLPLAGVSATAGDEPEFFVRVHPDRQSVTMGDSCLVSYVLYSSLPFVSVESDTKVKVKHARVRPVGIDRQATASRVVENGRVYYTLVWAQYVVVPGRTGEIVLPACKFKACLWAESRPRSLLEQFWGIRPEGKVVEAKAANKKIKLEVKEKPRRTTKEMMRRGSGQTA